MLNLKAHLDANPVPSGGPLPENSLIPVKVECTDLTTSQTGNKMIKINLIGEGRIKIMSQIMLTKDGGSAVSDIGVRQILAILSAAGIDIDNSANTSFDDERAIAQAIHGKTAVIKTKVNDRGYTDVRMFIAPNQALGTVRDWNEYLEKTGKAPVAQEAFRPQPATAQASPVQSTVKPSVDPSDDIPF